MTSRFVGSGGAEVELPVENDDWSRARKLVEERKKPQSESSTTQEGGKSLFEHLQAQKAAKQEAFEEATKLRNQFRPLDDSEIDFLDSIKRKELEEALEVRKETAEQLEAFRRDQAEIERASRDESLNQPVRTNDELKSWTTTKKRRRPQKEDSAIKPKAAKVTAAVDIDESVTSKPDAKESATLMPSSTGTKSPPARTADPPAPPTTVSPDVKKESSAPILVAYDSDSDT